MKVSTIAILVIQIPGIVALICRNGGSEQDGKCICKEGYVGGLCQTPRCSKPCLNGGTCIAPDFCECKPGYAGSRCQFTSFAESAPASSSVAQDCKSSADCNGANGGGSCTGSGKCQCSSLWKGKFCNDPVCPGGCGSYGTCTSPSKCTCHSGYGGSQCNVPLCTKACGTNQECIAPETCGCQKGWSGTGCSTPKCTQTCANGYCSAPNVCTCEEGWGGSKCEQVTKPTVKLGESCKFTAQCIGIHTYCERLSEEGCQVGACACKKGYRNIDGRCLQPVGVGSRCNSRSACTDNSECTVDGVCQCEAGFKRGPLKRCASAEQVKVSGEDCKSSDECYFDLICKSGKCGCPIGTIGDSQYTCRDVALSDACDSDIDCGNIERAECSYNYTTESGICECSSGYVEQEFQDQFRNQRKTCAEKQFITEGSVCSQNHETLCETGYACIQCHYSTSLPRCLWPGTARLIIGGASSVTVGVLTFPMLYLAMNSVSF